MLDNFYKGWALIVTHTMALPSWFVQWPPPSLSSLTRFVIILALRHAQIMCSLPRRMIVFQACMSAPMSMHHCPVHTTLSAQHRHALLNACKQV